MHIIVIRANGLVGALEDRPVVLEFEEREDDASARFDDAPRLEKIAVRFLVQKMREYREEARHVRAVVRKRDSDILDQGELPRRRTALLSIVEQLAHDIYAEIAAVSQAWHQRLSQASGATTHIDQGVIGREPVPNQQLLFDFTECVVAAANRSRH